MGNLLNRKTNKHSCLGDCKLLVGDWTSMKGHKILAYVMFDMFFCMICCMICLSKVT